MRPHALQQIIPHNHSSELPCPACNNSVQDITYRCDLVHQLFVLVPGTTVPVNFHSNGQYMTNAPLDANEAYWDSVGAEFKQELLHLISQIRRTNNRIGGETETLFDFGWNGLNSISARINAGDMLIEAVGNKLNGLGWLNNNQQIWLHFISHSHGGNVLNELLNKPALGALLSAQQGLRIRSIVYLSTPFFRNLHLPRMQVSSRIDKTINVFNQFDLTQRVIANFSVINHARFYNFHIYFSNGIKEAFKVLDRKNSRGLDYLDVVKDTIAKLIGMQFPGNIDEKMNRLNLNISFLKSQSKNFFNILKTEWQPLRPEFNSVFSLIDNIVVEIDHIPLYNQGFNLSTYVNVFNRLFTYLNELFDYNLNNQNASIAKAVIQFIRSIIERYDDTSNNPNVAYAGRQIRLGNIEHVDITSEDPILERPSDNPRINNQWNSLIRELEQIERDIQATTGSNGTLTPRSNEHILKLLIILISNTINDLSIISTLDRHRTLLGFITATAQLNPTVSFLSRLAGLFSSIGDNILTSILNNNSNNFLLKVTWWLRSIYFGHKNLPEGTIYLATNSHNLSRKKVYPLLREKLLRNAGCSADILNTNNARPSIPSTRI